jgi:hypothetical protein
MPFERSISRAYALAPLAAVGTLMLLPLGLAVAVGLAAGPTDGVLAGWILGLPVMLLALPLAYVGELVLVLVARLVGTDPRTARALPTILASAACAQGMALFFWLGVGREGSWALTFIAFPAGLVGGISFLALRREARSTRAI